MKVESGIRETTVKQMVEVMSIKKEREYTVTFTREEINLLRGLHWRLHNNSRLGVNDALNLHADHWSTTDGPAGAWRYDAFLSQIWHATNAFNGEV